MEGPFACHKITANDHSPTTTYVVLYYYRVRCACFGWRARLHACGAAYKGLGATLLLSCWCCTKTRNPAGNSIKFKLVKKTHNISVATTTFSLFRPELVQ